MAEPTIEAMLVSPPERDELVVHLFHTNGAQWGEIFRQGGAYRIEIFPSAGESVVALDAREMVDAVSRALDALKERLER